MYFGFAADANRRRRALLDDAAAPVELDLPGLERWARQGAVVIDARSPEVFASGHFRGSINVGLDGRFAEYAGDIALPGQAIVLVTDAGCEIEATVRLARIGFDSVRGAVAGIERILAERPDLAETSKRLAVTDLASWQAESPELQLLDVRNPAEQAEGIIEGARTIPLPLLLERLDELDQTAPVVVYCAGGYRSSVASSLLRAHGFSHVADIFGGFEAWRDAGLPTVTPRETSTTG